MANYMKAHFYRVIHKKSLYIYFGIILVGFILIMAFSANGLSGDAAVRNAEMFFSLAPVFFGGFVFAMVYNDDLSAKSLPSAIGFGLSRIKILISKLLITIIFTIVYLILMWVVYGVVCSMTGSKLSGDNWFTLFKMLASPLLLTLAYTAIASIAAFGTQKSTVALSIYLVFSTQIASQIIALLLMIPKIKEAFGDLSKYVLENVVSEINLGLIGGEWIVEGGANAQGVLEYTETFVTRGITAGPYILFAAFFAVMLILSGLAFRKKELEF